jgi:putative heme-binding domain-containing protein
MKAPLSLPFLVLLVAAALALRAQDHAEPTTEKAPADKGAATANASPAKGKGGGRGKAGDGAAAPDVAAKKGGGGRGLSEADLSADLEKIIANPTDLAKGQRIFEQQCATCHGTKGEGDRGPMLAQPTLIRATDDRTLVQIVARGIPGTEMPGGRMKAGEAPHLAAYVRSLGRIPMEKVPGDPAKGAELFKTKGACLSCHTIAGQGTAAIGPDLTDVGARRSPAFLRRSMVDPSADVPLSTTGNQNFAFIRVKTKDGKEASGVRINEGTFYVQFRDITGALYSFSKSELADVQSDRTSPMPVYAGLFTPGEMDDVIAYLVSLRGKKP